VQTLSPAEVAARFLTSDTGSQKEANVGIKTLIGACIALVLLIVGCQAAANPSSTPPVAAPSSIAASGTPVTTSAVAVTPPAQPSATPSGGPTTATTPTPAKVEEKSETPSAGEEAAEGPPMPNPLPTVAPGGNPVYAPVPGADITKNGAAASIHGSAVTGQALFGQNCAVCHGPEGKGGVANPGSDDGTAPPLNPIDPGFKASAKGDPAAFARDIDLFLQHGSRPAGSNPSVSMIPWGDQNRLSQQQIADVEAYVMQLNGLTWPSP
jgi:mono/diheme cytochrome c family protein